MLVVRESEIIILILSQIYNFNNLRQALNLLKTLTLLSIIWSSAPLNVNNRSTCMMKRLISSFLIAHVGLIRLNKRTIFLSTFGIHSPKH